MTTNQPFHQFKSAIADKLIDNKLFSAEWFAGQNERLSVFWHCGETVDSAYQIISIMAEAQLSKSSYKSPSIASLEAVGCEFITK